VRTDDLAPTVAGGDDASVVAGGDDTSVVAGGDGASVVAGGDDAFQERQWHLQRFGWVGMALVILAALAGGFGNGWLSARRTGDPAGLVNVGFERVVRTAAMTTIDVQLPATAAADGQVALSIDRAYVDRIELTEIMPPPRRASLTPDRLVFDFAVARPAAAAMQLTVRFRLIPHQPGRLDGRIGVGAGPPLAIRQFVLP
jgi:hypothetical protein